MLITPKELSYILGKSKAWVYALRKAMLNSNDPRFAWPLGTTTTTAVFLFIEERGFSYRKLYNNKKDKKK